MGTTTVNGVTYCTGSTSSLSLANIKSAFPSLANNGKLSSYRNAKFYKADFTRGNIASTGNLSLKSFYDTGGNIPRVDRTAWPAAGKFFTSGNIVLPPGFNTVSFIVYAGGGGGGGGNSAYSGGPYNGTTITGGAGSSGTSSSIVTAAGTYSATGGAGGNQGSAGANGSPDPGAATDYIPGGTGNGNGGKGGRYVSATTNADTSWATAAAMFNQNCASTYGTGGSGGSGGQGVSWNGFAYTFNGINGSNGNPGSAGGISVFIDLGLY